MESEIDPEARWRQKPLVQRDSRSERTASWDSDSMVFIVKSRPDFAPGAFKHSCGKLVLRPLAIRCSGAGALYAVTHHTFPGNVRFAPSDLTLHGSVATRTRCATKYSTVQFAFLERIELPEHQANMSEDFQQDVETVGRIETVPTILEVVCRTTGMGFAAVARVTEDRWGACSVLDEIDFGLKPGGELKVETTICQEIRQSRTPVVIDNVAEDDLWCTHATPAMYGFRSYISVPIILGDGSFFGTLCAIDPRPARLNTPETIRHVPPFLPS